LSQDSGITEWLKKPFDLDDLLALVASVLRDAPHAAE
jgi:DNA-binding response OmpR family regulator